MSITFDRRICCDLNETISREWLVTNGLGGYAAGTIAGVLTRMQHGLLVSSPLDDATPQLLLAKIDEEVLFDQRTYYLGTNEYRDETLNPSGFVHLETFRLEEGFPVFTYRLGGIDGILLEKRIWMPYGLNTTYIQYRVLRTSLGSDVVTGGTGRLPGNGNRRSSGYVDTAQRVLTLTLLPFSAYRPHNQSQHGSNDWHFQVDVHSADNDLQRQSPVMLPKGVAGCTIHAWDGAHPYHILAVGHANSQTTFIPTGVWYWNFLRRHDRAAGRDATDDLYLPGVIRAKLWPGDDAALTLIVTAEELSMQTFSVNQLHLSYKRCVENARDVLQPERYFGEGGETAHYLNVLPLTTPGDLYTGGAEYLRLLLQAGERFLARRKLPRNEQRGSRPLFFSEPDTVPVLLSDYFGLDYDVRDALIALPGLTLTTGRYDEASRILRSFLRYFKHGMLPDRLPLTGRPLKEQDYASVDTTLWYFYALDCYLRATQDYELLNELYHHLVESIDWYVQGTSNGVRVDSDGLVRAQQPGKALTWMNAAVDGIAVTPREGKPVEVNALWYYALCLMREWAERQYAFGRTLHSPSYYEKLSTRCKESFQQRFWYAEGGYLYDVIDGPNSDDTALRPNQLLALSLRHPVLDKERWQRVFERVTQHLMTPYGLRTLAPGEAGYCGRLPENGVDQQRALHQGSCWPWLLGPYIDALLNIQSPPLKAVKTQQERQRKEQLWQRGLEALVPFCKQMHDDMLGMIGGAFDGNEPQRAHYQVASALSLGELLRVYNLLVQLGVKQPSWTGVNTPVRAGLLR